tara:strand:+ start:304 stop:486 length:183 start_codon:yes stop_codon:yes gene_type:complete
MRWRDFIDEQSFLVTNDIEMGRMALNFNHYRAGKQAFPEFPRSLTGTACDIPLGRLSLRR